MRSLLIMLLSICLYSAASAQNAKLVNGNYVAITKAKADTTPKATGQTFTDAKGNVYPVYKSVNDKLYIIRTSRNGNQYKQYLKV